MPLLRIPRPKAFLGFISLQTGTELISLALIFNKLTGFYGVLAIFTGYALSALQLSMYIYSLACLILLAIIIPHIRKQTPLHNLALAWLYVADTVLNAAFTTAFAVMWYLASAHDPKGPAGAQSDVHESGDPKGALDDEQLAQIEAGVGAQETAFSMVLIVAFTVLRIYLSLVVMSYASAVLQNYMDHRATSGDDEAAKSGDFTPFAVGAPEGEGWRGKVGRALLYVGKTYWLGRKPEDLQWSKEAPAETGESSRMAESSQMAEPSQTAPLTSDMD